MTNPTILLVDDDIAILEGVTDLLRVSGYNVITAANGIEALQVMQSQVADLIVADIMMPVMDGYQLYQAVRENPAWTMIPFIFLSAKGQKKDVRYGYTLGVDHYLTKPFEPEDLLVAVQTRLRRMDDIQAASREDVERTKQQLLTVFGHELRTPLSYVYGYLSLLQEAGDSLGEEATGEILRGMWRGTERLTKLVEDLMLLVYVDSGAAQLMISHHSKSIDIGYEIQAAMRDLSADAQERDIAVSMVVQDGLTVLGAPEYIRDIFKRLIDNAIKFSRPQGGHIWISAEAQGNQVVIEVRDDGIGIAADQQKHLFERFQQIDREKLEQQGVGVGLAIAGRLTHLHGGTIEVESQPGEGSTFTVVLPLQTV